MISVTLIATILFICWIQRPVDGLFTNKWILSVLWITKYSSLTEDSNSQTPTFVHLRVNNCIYLAI